MAGSGALPMQRAACEEAIRRAGKGADASLRGFDAGFRLASGEWSENLAKIDEPMLKPQARVVADFPVDAQEVLLLGVERLVDYQGPRYAELYLERMRRVLAVDPGPGHQLTSETGRHLAVWMSYEDVIRVADLKSRLTRFERVRKEVNAKPGEPVVVIDYLKPGADEFASLLPPALGAKFLAWAERTGRLHSLNLGMHVKTSSAFGYLSVRALAWLKPWRPHSYRYALEQQLIERWLGHVCAAAKRDAQLALEIAECARLVKGYSDTHRRGVANFLAILDALVENPATNDTGEQARAIAKAREAALADPDGKALSADLGRPVNTSKPVIWLSKSA
jgi:indolepyruvate ferredoxin oxidoreductase, beta subunit